MNRVMVVGGPGSGKSTMAIALGEITGLPVFHMDQIHYRSGWAERELDDKISMANAVEARNRWIFEGGLSSTYVNRSARADTVIWLDLPLSVRLARIMKRRIRFNATTRPDLPDNCPERLDPSFQGYMYRTRHAGRARIPHIIHDAPHQPVPHLRPRTRPACPPA